MIYRGWKIEPTQTVQLGYRTETNQPGKGRKDSGYEVYYPEGGTKFVSTMKRAKAYVDEYLGPEAGETEKERELLRSMGIK